MKKKYLIITGIGGILLLNMLAILYMKNTFYTERAQLTSTSTTTEKSTRASSTKERPSKATKTTSSSANSQKNINQVNQTITSEKGESVAASASNQAEITATPASNQPLPENNVTVQDSSQGNSATDRAEEAKARQREADLLTIETGKQTVRDYFANKLKENGEPYDPERVEFRINSEFYFVNINNPEAGTAAEQVAKAIQRAINNLEQ
ncbi:hypothetical protein I6N95_01320 [Vagococcus sp. BWB3-3]|uniref:Uncharacterized protein n=1 Tax=Vagococcus allomyrinae TaxID=2794353 RepID=A0A940P1A8_9ENTE|nr:hypothetical protein [Vagococcus allomyrinae]MBP1039637.1 hypothetical protein [Vagococcus allomyrinae]